MPPSLQDYREVQAKACLRLLKAEGVTETWYYEVPALVLLGSRSGLSVSGRDDTPATGSVY